MLSWPWEALYDPEIGVIGQTCQVERRVEKNVRDAPPLSKDLPTDAVNILLVIARPFEGDVSYRSVGRPLVELIEEKGLPAQVTVLRPPTFESLREHLQQNQNRYHIVHFDGHGGYFDTLHLESDDSDALPAPAEPSRDTYAPSGHLHFELTDSTETLSEMQQVLRTAVKAEDIAAVLREAKIPTVVLNACQSAMLTGAKDPFASVAAALLQAGVRNVVAMAYSLYVSGAQVFLPA